MQLQKRPDKIVKLFRTLSSLCGFQTDSAEQFYIQTIFVRRFRVEDVVC